MSIPEPLMFDLVRGLGARQGELEINALAEFPLNNGSDRGVDWAPEIEYALFNNFAVELEFPMNNFELEAFKTAIQWTIGSSENKKFINGIQVLGEMYIHDDITELNLLYVPAYRFNEIWSAIGLFGVMFEFGSDSAEKDYTMPCFKESMTTRWSCSSYPNYTMNLKMDSLSRWVWVQGFLTAEQMVPGFYALSKLFDLLNQSRKP